jgi:putative hydrolase of the HAD superfamily
MWNKSWMFATLYDEVEDVLNELKQNHRLVLVSNTDSISVSNVLDKFNMRKYFHHIFLSCDKGKLKTDRDFFPLVMKELNIQPEDCLMVGDSIQSDIIAARQHGIKAILVDRRDTRQFTPKIINLTQLRQYV